MHRRRTLILLLLVAVMMMGIVLFMNVRPSQLFRIAAPPNGVGRIQAEVSSTLGNTEATAQAKSQAMALATKTLLENPRYTGQDSLGRSWTLTAATAGQEGTATSGTYVLQKVEAMWHDPSRTTPMTLTANQGRYTPAASGSSGTLKLTGDVVGTGLGFTITAEGLDADLATRELTTSGGSRVKGQTGQWDMDMTAPTLHVEQVGKTADANGSTRLLLTGGVHAILTPTKGLK